MIFFISVFYFFYFAVIGVYIIFMPKVLELIGYDAWEIGVIFSSAPLVRFLVPFLFIRGFRLNNTSFYAALGILTLSVATFYFSVNDFYALIATNVFFGIGLSLILPYVELIALEKIGKERYGKSRLFGSFGFMLVALVLVRFLSDPLTALHYLVVATYVTILFAFLVVARTRLHRDTTYNVSNDVSLFRDWKLWLGFMLMQVSFGGFYNFFTIYETAHGVSLDTTIYLWSFGVAVEIVMLYVQGRFLRGNLTIVLQITTAVTAFRWLLVFLFPQNLWVLFFSQSLHALSFALFHSAAISYLFSLYTNKPLAQQLFSGISYGLGGLLGALIAGFVYEYYPRYLFLVCALIAFAAFFYIRSYALKIRK